MLANEAQMLERMWFPVARVQDVEAGRPFAGQLLGRRLVVFSGGGEIAVALDRCPHRGARLSQGRMSGEALECPYHGWRWQADGHCALVPSQPGAHPGATLATLPVRVRFGLVWAALAEPGLDQPPSIPETDDAEGGWEFADGAWFEVACGLRSITENFRDSSHFAFVHRDTFGDVNPEVPPYTVAVDGRRLSWEFPLTFGSAWAVDGGADDKYRFGAVDGEGRGGDTEVVPLHYRFELPSLAYVYTEHEGKSRRLVCQAAAPLDTESARCRVFFFVAADAAFRERFGDLAKQVAIETKVFSEDVPIVENLDPTEAPLDLEGQAHVRADRYSIAYRKLYGQLIDDFEGSRTGQ